MRDLLVTGTDTGVGKTVVAAGLILALRQRGSRALGFKPVETGIEAGVPSDSEVLASASGLDDVRARPLLRLPEALAPAVAAERAGVTLDPSEIEARIAALRSAGHRLVIEGAGGLFVPLAWSYTALELAVHCDLAVVIVARAGLGTLNHTLLTVAALQQRGVALAGIVLNGVGDPPSLAESTNPGALARLLPGVTCIALPRWPDLDSLAAARRAAPLLVALLDHG